MYDDLRARAIQELEKRNKKKKKVAVVGVIFAAVSILLFLLSLMVNPSARFWVRFPIYIFGLVYAIIHVSALGLPFLNLDEITEDEIEREIVKIYKLSGLDAQGEALELRDEELELEELTNRVEGRDDYV